MPIAAFGYKVFQVSASKVYTFSDFALSSTLETESQEVEGAKPSTYIKGPGLETISFKVVADASLGVDPEYEMNDWRAIKDLGQAFPFSIGGRPLSNNLWLLKSVSINNTVINGAGKILRATIDLSFEEFVRIGAKKEKETAEGAGFKSGSNLVDILIPDKASEKRENPNLAASTQIWYNKQAENYA